MLTEKIDLDSLMQRMLLGAFIGFGLISLFVFTVDNPPKEWGQYWQIRPLIIAPLVGAFGMWAFYLKDVLQPTGKMLTLLTYAFSILAFLIALWLGIVLSLDGTLWN